MRNSLSVIVRGFCLLLSVFLFSISLNGQSIIEVFVDLNSNGLRDASEDQLVANVNFRATRADGSVVEVVDLGDGNYTISNEERVRVDVLSFPSEYQAGYAGSTTVFFAEPGSNHSVSVITNLADSVLIDTMVIEDTNLVFLPCYDAGAAEMMEDVPAVISFPYTVDGISEENAGSAPNPSMIVSMQQVGSTWGVGLQTNKNRVFASAMLKRHVGVGPMGVGGLYVINRSDAKLSSYDLHQIQPRIGPQIDLGSIRRNIITGDVVNEFDLSTDVSQSWDSDAFDKVGKVSFGDIDVTEDQSELWLVNLNQRSLIRLNIESDTIDPTDSEHYLLDDISGLPDKTYHLSRNINCGKLDELVGAVTFTDANNQAWERNKYRTVGDGDYIPFDVENAMTDGYTEAHAYQTFAFGPRISYEVPVPNDRYTVTLQFAEPDAFAEIGDREMEILLEDVTVADVYDIVEEAGGNQRAVKVTYETTITDGILNIDLLGIDGSDAILMGIMVNGTSEMQTGVLRPWGISFYEGRGYIGLVNDASFSRSRNHVNAYILSFNPNNINEGFRTEVDFPLDYRREKVSKAHDLSQLDPFRRSAWEAWISTWDEAHLETVNEIPRLAVDYPQPVLSDIDFDGDGNIIFALMDRWGHQAGHLNYIANPDFSVARSANVNNLQLIRAYGAGDILKACNMADGTFMLECESNDNGVFYENDDGPSQNGEFFAEDFFDNGDAIRPGIPRSSHGEIITGGLGIMDGEMTVLNTVYNPVADEVLPNGGIFSQGLHAYSTMNGARERAYLFIGDDGNNGKANGLGDLEAARFLSTIIQNNTPPFEIGNLIWVDSDKDGIQDADEYGIPGVEVVLYCIDEGTVVARTTTNADGEYIFQNILSNKCYEIRVDLSQGAFNGLDATVTSMNSGSNDNIDSDASGDIIPGFAVIEYCTQIVNENNHSLDIGINGPPALDAESNVCTFEPGTADPRGVFMLDGVLSARIDTSAVNTVEYFASRADAINRVNALSVIDTTVATTRYARVTSPISSNIFSIAEVELIVTDGVANRDFSIESCAGFEIVLSDAVQVDFDTLQFFEDAGFSMEISGNTYTPTSLPATIYYRASDSTTCIITGALNINPIPEPTIEAGDPATVCAGEKLNLSTLGHSFSSNGSGATEAVWTTSGSGMFVPSNRYGEAIQYMSSDNESGSVVLRVEITDYACATTPIADSVVIFVNDTCPKCPQTLNCLTGINISCGSRVTVEDVITSEIEPQNLGFYNIRLEDPFGTVLSNPLPVNYEGEFIIRVWVDAECGNLSCETTGTMTTDKTCVVFDNLDTAVWCIDPFLQLDPNSKYYDPYRPMAELPCRGTKISVLYEGDQVITMPADSDTAKLIIRCWYADLPSKDVRCRGCDTIVVYKLPEIGPDNLIVPQKDSIYCRLKQDTIVYRKELSFISWKEIVGLHSEGTYIGYPKDKVDEIVSNAVGDSFAIAELRKYPLIINSNYSDSITLFEVMTEMILSADGEEYLYAVNYGDHILSNDGLYITVDRNWFYIAGEHGYWVDLSIPVVDIKRRIEVCDVWGVDYCDGIKLVLPNRPINPDSCTLYCLNDDVIKNSKCCLSLNIEETDLGGNCPTVIKKHTTIKQLCYSDLGLTLPSNCTYTPDSTGIYRNEDGLVEIEQWINYFDTLAPLIKDVRLERSFVIDDHDCLADILVPGLYAKDDCSGVKGVKATIVSTSQFVELVQSEDGYWIHPEGRTIRLPYGEHRIDYEVFDKCHNEATYSTYIEVHDFTAPTSIVDDEILVSLGSKEVWIKAENLYKDVIDNCGVRMTLARRADWKTAGIDLCSDEISSFTTEAELRNFINSNGIQAVLSQNDVEQYYSDAYEWLKYDGNWCENLDNYVVQGWEDDIVAYWAENCAPSDDHGNPLINRDPGQIGGGWSSSVPFFCEDACKEIVVELLHIDYACNYTKSWLIVRPEDKSAVTKASEFDEISISCDAYSRIYESAINAAVDAGNNSQTAIEEFAAVDELLGSIMLGWRSEDNRLVDRDGSQLTQSFDYVTSYCRDVITHRQVLVSNHDGTEDWVDIYDTTVVIEDTVYTARKGGVFVLCGATVQQDIWVDIDDCGLGTVTRRWTVFPGCNVKEPNPLVYTQKINVKASCELSKNMFDVPEDTTICTTLTYTADGKVSTDLPEMEYRLNDQNCRNLGISYIDHVFRVAGESNLYKVHRNWTATDWCSDEKIYCQQKILIWDTCAASVSRQLTATFENPDGDVVRHVVVEMLNLSTNEESQSIEENGLFDSKISTEYEYRITPSKKDLPAKGIDIRDILMIQRSILQGTSLDKYEQIAADVNDDGIVNSKDIVIIRQLLLGMINKFPVDSWKLFDKSSEESYTVITAGNEDAILDYMGVKIGDVSRKLEIRRSSNSVTLFTEVNEDEGSVNYVVGEEGINSLDALHFMVDGWNSKNFEISSDVFELTSANWYVNDAGRLSIILHEIENADLNKGDVLLRIQTKEGNQFADLNSQSYLVVDDHKYLVNVQSQTGIGNIELHQSVPNPASDFALVPFTLSEDMYIELSFIDISGRELHKVSGNFDQGLNKVPVRRSDLNVDGGIIFYHLRAGDYFGIGKMILSSK